MKTHHAGSSQARPIEPDTAVRIISNADKPTVIIAHTIKGKGVSYMEGSPAWHGSLKLSIEDLTQALLELGAKEEEINGYINE